MSNVILEIIVVKFNQAKQDEAFGLPKEIINDNVSMLLCLSLNIHSLSMFLDAFFIPIRFYCRHLIVDTRWQLLSHLHVALIL